MTEQELDYVVGFVEAKFKDIPPHYIAEIRGFLENFEFSKEQAMSVIVIAENIAMSLYLFHEE